MTSHPVRTFRFLIAVLAFGLAGSAWAESAPAGALSQHTLDKHTAPVLKALKLSDSTQVAAVRSAVEAHFQAVDVWHRRVDSRLDALWADWSKARTPPHQDETKAAAIGAKIDAIYGTFQRQHDAFIRQLAAVLPPSGVETVEDALTRTPGLKRTYDAYLEIVPTLTESEKAHIHATLVVARDEALDTLSKKEQIALFKKQKVKVQEYIQSEGYDWKKSYAAFVARLKAESAARKAH
ncbi:MAG TPA: DUF3826 domain-containing protein [Opitutaceae bacterium]|nr:DUF3826 domain-containing protein [Opitutaceae bacterium]